MSNDVSNDNPAPPIEVNLPFGHIPRCACDTGPALSHGEYRVKVAACKLQRRPVPRRRGGNMNHSLAWHWHFRAQPLSALERRLGLGHRRHRRRCRGRRVSVGGGDAMIALAWVCVAILFAWLFPDVVFLIAILGVFYWWVWLPVLAIGSLVYFTSGSRRYRY